MTGYLAIGHGQEPSGVFDPGATAPDGTTEHALNAVVVNVASLALDRAGVDHYVEVDGGASHDPDYRGSVTAVNAGHYAWAVEVHFDDASEPSGGFGIYLNDQSPAKQLDQAIRARWGAAGLAQRPNYADVRGLWFLRGTDCPSLIWECDATRAHEPGVLERMGEALAAGLCDWLGVTYVPPGPPGPSPIRPQEADMQFVGCTDPDSGGSWQIQVADGALFAYDGAPYEKDALNNHPEWKASAASSDGKHQIQTAVAWKDHHGEWGLCVHVLFDDGKLHQFHLNRDGTPG